jgi:hypothetical protein
MNLNSNQVLSIALVVMGVLVASTTQLTDLFGAAVTKDIVAVAGLGMSILAGVQGVISGQASQVRAVQAMPGVEKIVVNGQANQTLAQIAVDPNSKVEATPQATATVQNTARGA